MKLLACRRTLRIRLWPEKIFTPAELYDAWPVLSLEERVEGFEFLTRDDADDFFLQLSARDRAQLLLALPTGERRLWMRLLAPDDAADVIQEAPAEERESHAFAARRSDPQRSERACSITPRMKRAA